MTHLERANKVRISYPADQQQQDWESVASEDFERGQISGIEYAITLLQGVLDAEGKLLEQSHHDVQVGVKDSLCDNLKQRARVDLAIGTISQLRQTIDLKRGIDSTITSISTTE